jgi:phosphatidylethanolamine/phosphatidyl-N-methylethanolamine N-methyltransferase
VPNNVITRIVAEPPKQLYAEMGIKSEIDDTTRFFRAWMDKPLQVGAIAPSSAALARAIANEVDVDSIGPVIELGPGTGAVTEALVEHGILPDRLVLVEFNPVFCEMLRARYPKALIVEGDAYDLIQHLETCPISAASAVVSGLPLYARTVERRVSLLRQAFKLLAPGAPFIQFTYAVTSPIPRQTPKVISHGSTRIWLNLPPARIWTYRDASRIA